MINDVDGEDHDAWVWVRLENPDDYDDESQKTSVNEKFFFAQLAVTDDYDVESQQSFLLNCDCDQWCW